MATLCSSLGKLFQRVFNYIIPFYVISAATPLILFAGIAQTILVHLYFLDSLSNWSWSLVLLPTTAIFILFGIIAICLFFSLVDFNQHPCLFLTTTDSHFAFFLLEFIIGWLCFFLTFLFTVAKLEGSDQSWYLIAIPLWTYFFIIPCFEFICVFSFGFLEQHLTIFVFKAIFHLFLIVQCLFYALYLQGDGPLSKASAFVVSIPFIIFFGLPFLVILVVSILTLVQYRQQTDQNTSFSEILLSFVFLLINIACPFIIILLICQKIDEPDSVTLNSIFSLIYLFQILLMFPILPLSVTFYAFGTDTWKLRHSDELYEADLAAAVNASLIHMDEAPEQPNQLSNKEMKSLARSFFSTRYFLMTIPIMQKYCPLDLIWSSTPNIKARIFNDKDLQLDSLVPLEKTSHSISQFSPSHLKTLSLHEAWNFVQSYPSTLLELSDSDTSDFDCGDEKHVP